MTGSARRRGGYVKRTGNLICEQLALGKTLLQAFDHIGYLAPTLPQFWKWLEEHPDFREQYERARQLQADVHADKMLELSQDALKNPRAAGVYKVATDVLKWQAEVRNSGRYGRKAETKKQERLNPDKIRDEIKRLQKELGVREKEGELPPNVLEFKSGS